MDRLFFSIKPNVERVDLIKENLLNTQNTKSELEVLGTLSTNQKTSGPHD